MSTRSSLFFQWASTKPTALSPRNTCFCHNLAENYFFRIKQQSFYVQCSSYVNKSHLRLLNDLCLHFQHFFPSYIVTAKFYMKRKPFICLVSEWLLLNANSAMFPAISLREQVNSQWDADEVHFVLDQHLICLRWIPRIGQLCENHNTWGGYSGRAEIHACSSKSTRITKVEPDFFFR